MSLSFVASGQNKKEEDAKVDSGVSVYSAPDPGDGGGTAPDTPPDPTASTNYCGDKTLTRSGNPPSGVVWFWQTSASGTSMDNGSATHTVSSSGTYYIRAHDIYSNLWSSGSGSVSVTVNPNPSAPSQPSVQNNCGSSTLTRGTSPSGITWYWQGMNSSGTSTSNSSSTYTAYTSGTYYLRSRNNTTGCWGGSVGVSVSPIQLPLSPDTPTVSTNYCGNKTLSVSSPHITSGVRWFWQGKDANGTSQAYSGDTYQASSAGTYYIRAYDIGTGCWSLATSAYVSEVNPLPSTPSTPTVQNNCGSSKLTRGTPPSDITWYWQGKNSSGTSTSNSSTTYTASSAGTYYLRSQNNSTGCWGPSASVTASPKVLPAAPSTPTVQSYCESATLTRGTPPSGVTWYWQGTNSNGTSTSNSSSTYTATIQTYYFIRSRTSEGCWGPSTSVYASFTTPPPAPDTPTVSTNLCGDKTLMVTPPHITTGLIWFWQGTNPDGKSETTKGSTYSVSTPGTYYIRAKDIETGCWSASVGVPVNEINHIPPTPTGLSASTNLCGDKMLTVDAPSGGWYTHYWRRGSANEFSEDNPGDSFTATQEGTYTYYVRGKHNISNCWGPEVSVSVTVNHAPADPVAVSGKTQIGKNLAVFEASGSTGEYYWYTAAVGGSPISTQPSASFVELIGATTTRYAESQSGVGCVSNRVPVTVTAHGFPVIEAIGQNIINFNQEWVELRTTTVYDSYQWIKNETTIEGATQRNYQAMESGYYYVVVTKNGVPGKVKSDPFRVQSGLQSEKKSYSINTAVLVEGANTKADVALLTAGEKLQSIAYADELGRPKQSIALGASPAGNDMVSVKEYDQYGRTTKNYMPYVVNSGTGEYDSSYITKINNFYQATGDNIANTITPFAEVELENSPYQRVKKSGAVGEEWQIDGQHITAYDYAFNNGTEGILKWEISVVTELPVAIGTYAQGQLRISTVTNEGKTVKTYTSSRGEVVLEEVVGETKTYNVYDNYGNLRYVLPPALVATGNQAPDQTLINNLAFCYEYDHLHRPIASKAPGAGWKYNVYDQLDRLVLTQDANQWANNQWMFVKYDVFDRPVSTGVYTDASDRQTMQDKLDRYYAQKIVWTQFQGTEVVDGLLTSTAASGWGNAGASTGTYLQDGQDGTIHIEAKYVNDRYMIGFSDTDVDANYNTIDYALYINQSVFYVYENGVKKWNTGYLNQGDVFQVERKGSEIRYKRNGDTFYTTKNAQTGPLIVDAALYNTGDVIKTTFPQLFEEKGGSNFGYSNMTFPQVEDDSNLLSVTYYDNYDFHHANLPDYAFVPDEDHGAYFNMVKGLVTGTKTRILGEDRWINTVNYYDDKHRLIQGVGNDHKEGSQRISNTYDFTGKVLESELTHYQPMKMIWKNIVNTEIDGNTITSVSGGTWSSGVSSANTLAENEDGWMETIVMSTDGYKFIGFNDWDDSWKHPEIDYAVYFYGRSLRAWRNGTQQADLGVVDLGDKVRMERVNGEVRVLVNDVLKYTFTDPSTSQLVVDVSFYKAPASLAYVTCSFSTPNAKAPYPVLWTGMRGAYSRPDSLVKTAVLGWTNAGASSINKLTASENGWASFKAASPSEKLMFGLAESDEALTYHAIDYAIYLHEDSTILVYENGANKGWFGKYQAGDVFKVERNNKIVTYHHNGQVFYTSETPSATELIVDVSIAMTNSIVLEARTSFDYVSPTKTQADITRGFDYDHAGRLLKTWHSIAEPVKWHGLSGLTNIDGELRVEEGLSFGVARGDVLEAGEYGIIEYTAADIAKGKRIGFRNTTNSADRYYMEFYLSHAIIAIRKGGALQSSFYYGVGSRLKIERKPGQINFYHNGVLLNSFAVSDAGEFEVWTELTEAETTLSDVKLMRGPVLLAEYQYNELGQVVKKNVHSEDEVNFLQSTDYAYNIRGWLKSINDPDNIQADQLFGMELLYNESLNALGQTPAYDGNITAIKWKNNIGEKKTKAYAYSYDKLNRLTDAAFGSGTGFAEQTGFYDESAITYDANGNITRLNRYSGNYQTSTKIDELIYNYGADKSNQLLKVKDDMAHEDGFKDVAGDDYAYDSNGNIITDANKGITAITYNILNKPATITFDNGTSIQYIYDASGANLARKLYNNGTLETTTDYIGGMVYENDTLQFFGHAEGRVVFSPPSQGGAGGGYEYQYAYTDHLGNIRMLYTANPDTHTFTATMETEANEQADDALFTKVDETNAVDIDATSYNEVSRLFSSQPIGPGISLPMYLGDKATMTVKAYHRGGSDFNNPLDLTTFIATLAGAFGGVNGGTAVEQATFNVFDNAVNPVNGGFGLLGTTQSTRPAAYLNYILFDKHMNMYQHGHAQISESGALETLSLADIEATKEGWIYVYLSNESNSLNEVYFDDMVVTIEESMVVQNTDYYPFGLQHNTSWTRPTDLKNNFLFNAGSELNEQTKNYETAFRHYDPALGRFMGVDAFAGIQSSVNPYHFGFNNPVMHNDPSGLYPPGLIEGLNESIEAARWLAASGGGAYGGSISQNHWINQIYASFGADGVERNARVMSGAAFRRMYGIDQMSSQDKFNFANSIASPATSEQIPDIVARMGWQFENGRIHYKKDGKYHVDISFTERLTQSGGGDGGSWFDNHYYSEGSFAVTLGPQGTAIPTPEGLIPAPYFKGGLLGINLNLGSRILIRGQADTKNGARITETYKDKVFTQGVGIAAAGQSLDFTRMVGPMSSENVLSFVSLGGLFGVEYNFTSGEMSIGMMPSAKWALGIGIEGGMKQVVKFKF